MVITYRGSATPAGQRRIKFVRFVGDVLIPAFNTFVQQLSNEDPLLIRIPAKILANVPLSRPLSKCEAFLRYEDYPGWDHPVVLLSCDVIRRIHSDDAPAHSRVYAILELADPPGIVKLSIFGDYCCNRPFETPVPINSLTSANVEDWFGDFHSLMVSERNLEESSVSKLEKEAVRDVLSLADKIMSKVELHRVQVQRFTNDTNPSAE